MTGICGGGAGGIGDGGDGLGGREAVEAGVGEDLAGVVVALAGGEDGGAGDGDCDDDGLEDEGADDPSGDGTGGVALGTGGEELLVHGLVAEHEQAGGEEEFERGGDALAGAVGKKVRSEMAVDGIDVAEDLEVSGGEGDANGGPSAEAVDEDGQRETEGEGGEQADDDVHVGDRRHAGDGGEEDDEGGDEVAAVDGGDGGGGDEVEDVSAADELVAGDGGVGEEDGDDAEDAGGLVVAGFEQVGDGVLGEAAGAPGKEGK